MKKVNIITINYNHSKETIDCINAILASDYSEYSITLIDNGSEENDYIMLCQQLIDKRVNIVRQIPNIGYVGGVNRGLEEALKLNPDYFLIMNNDTIIDKSAISELVAVAQKHQDNAIISGKVYNIDEPDTLQYIGQWSRNPQKFDYPPYIKDMKEKDEGQYEIEMELGMADDIYWLLPLKVFDSVGYYSTDFFLYGEQNDYALRALKKGFKLIYTPKAKLWHYHHLTTSGGDLKSLRVLYWKEYATFILMYRHIKHFDFLYIYLKSLVKSIIKYFIYNFSKKTISQKQQQEVKLKAIWYFTKWMFSPKKVYNGFNPI